MGGAGLIPIPTPVTLGFRRSAAMTPFNLCWIDPMATQPGKVWAYNGGYSQIFSAIVTDKTGMNTMEFAKKNLFSPLGITNFIWRTDRQGV